MFDISHNGRTTLDTTRPEAEALGYPEAVIAQAEATARGALIAAECRRRIYAVASAETQMNMASAASLISAKTASQRSEQEAGVLVGLEAALGWVQAMRAKVAEMSADPDAEIYSDESWPDAPAEAVAVASQF